MSLKHIWRLPPSLLLCLVFDWLVLTLDVHYRSLLTSLLNLCGSWKLAPFALLREFTTVLVFLGSVVLWKLLDGPSVTEVSALFLWEASFAPTATVLRSQDRLQQFSGGSVASSS